MTFRRVVQCDVCCDGCGDHLLEEPEDRTAPDLREQARKDGWAFSGTPRQDFCSACVARWGRPVPMQGVGS